MAPAGRGLGRQEGSRGSAVHRNRAVTGSFGGWAAPPPPAAQRVTADISHLIPPSQPAQAASSQQRAWWWRVAPDFWDIGESEDREGAGSATRRGAWGCYALCLAPEDCRLFHLICG